MVSEESLAFVDLMRKDDMDRRATMAREQTNPDERGEQDQASVTEDAKTESVSSSGESAEQNESLFQQEEEVITTPAVPVSEVALGTDPLQASISNFEQAEASDSFQEDGNQPEQVSLFTEPGPNPAGESATSETGAETDPPSIFTSQGQEAAPNSRLEEEGVRVTEIPNNSGETTMLVPEDMTDFSSMLKRFDSDYRTPDIPVGDDLAFPEIEEEPESEQPETTVEFAESMMAGMTQDLLKFERRGT